MRKIIPLEEIKRLRSGSLTLEDCLRRHLIVLERKKQNLKAIESFCSRVLAAGQDLQALPMEKLLLEMEDMEKGGTKFMDIRKKDNRKRKQGAFLAAGSAILFMAWLLGIMALAMATDPEVPVPVIIFIIAFPVVGITGILFALFQRIKEIEGGELDEASNIDYIPGKEIEVLDLVKGTVVHSKNIGRDFMASMKTLVGGELVGYTEMLNEARQIAVMRMVDEAQALGADAVINIRYGSSAVMSGAAEIIAYGTAVKILDK